MTFLKFNKPKIELEQGGRCSADVHADESEPEKTCPNCRRSTPLSRLQSNLYVCGCGYHFRMNARQRISFITERDSFTELFADVVSGDPLSFPGYVKKLETARAASGENEAVICGAGDIGGAVCGVFVMEAGFMMGSMGAAAGERITRLFEFAAAERLPVVGYTVSGGARMQEGLLSLAQMAKTSAAVKRHGDLGLFYLTVLTDPTTGGVTASFAMQGDIILAEPGATVGFAGARVVEQTTHKALPKGFQKSEFLLEHGFIDAVVPRGEQKSVLKTLLNMHNTGGFAGARKTAGRSV